MANLNSYATNYQRVSTNKHVISVFQTTNKPTKRRCSSTSQDLWRPEVASTKMSWEPKMSSCWRLKMAMIYYDVYIKRPRLLTLRWLWYQDDCSKGLAIYDILWLSMMCINCIKHINLGKWNHISLTWIDRPFGDNFPY